MKGYFEGVYQVDESEMALSCSTPGCRFDVVAAAAPEESGGDRTGAVGIDFGASRFLSRTLEEHPVVMFALEWCEFCWAARKLFQAMDVDFESVDLDSVGLVVAVIALVQIFIGGDLIGGCSELFDAYHDGTLQRRLLQSGVRFNGQARVDTAKLLPQWLHPRISA